MFNSFNPNFYQKTKRKNQFTYVATNFYYNVSYHDEHQLQFFLVFNNHTQKMISFYS